MTSKDAADTKLNKAAGKMANDLKLVWMRMAAEAPGGGACRND